MTGPGCNCHGRCGRCEREIARLKDDVVFLASLAHVQPGTERAAADLARLRAIKARGKENR
jgi:hypothetical protein